MGTRTIVGLILVLLCACTRRQRGPNFPPDVVQYHQEAWRDFNKTAASFSVADGVDQREANLLAQAFFLWKVGACGFAEAPEDAGGEWHSHPRIGYAGQPGSDIIRIDKRTGTVSYASEPPVAAASVIQHERERLRDNLRSYGGESAGDE
jgi:hypothetical protein